MKLGGGSANSFELLLLKFLSFAYHHSHFLAANLHFTSFSPWLFGGHTLFFTAWLFWIRKINLLWMIFFWEWCDLQSPCVPIFGVQFLCKFFVWSILQKTVSLDKYSEVKGMLFLAMHQHKISCLAPMTGL